MKTYSTILFDADDTLLDFHRDEHDALVSTFERCHLSAEEAVINAYSAINAALWREHEKGNITKEDIKNIRFSELFKKIKVNSKYTPRQVNDIYAEYLCEGSAVVSGAYEVCRKLSEKYEMYIVTNGIEITQKSRLAKSGFDKLMQGLFISESIGLQKPSSKFFDYVFEHINEKDKTKVILVGDSLSSDIKGALTAGIDCVWLNKNHIENNSGLEPTYEIGDIREIIKIL